MNRRIVPVLAAVLLLLTAGAGCITEDLPAPLPDTALLTTTLNAFNATLARGIAEADECITAFSHDIVESSAAGSPEQTEHLVRAFYIDNIRLTAAGYYDAATNHTFTTPISSEYIDLKTIYENTTFDGDKTLIYGPIITEQHGTLCAFIHPVYTAGEITGMVISFFDPVAFITDVATENGGLNGLGALLIDTNGIIFYSGYGSNIGHSIYNYSDEWAAVPVYRTITENPAGLTAPFKSRTPSWDGYVWKQAAWTTAPILDRTFRVAVLSCEKLPELPPDYRPDYEAMEDAVKELYMYIAAHGKEQTLRELNKPDGMFAHDGFDLFALDTNGTLLGSQKRQYQIGLSCVNWRSAYGTKPAETWADIAQTSGGGWYYYPMAVSEDPLETKGMLACTYLMLIDQSWYIGSQIPALADRLPVNIRIMTELENTMQTALQMYLDEGDAALQKYTDLAGDTQDIYVLTDTGTVLASSDPLYAVG
ncbi:MAG: hypothetical protein Q4Q04_04660, partial [Methanocorpusculum sp.]|nr:hypothetical protein [Methanocorpusculum sp.]